MTRRAGSAWSVVGIATAFIFMGQTGVVDFTTNVASRFKSVTTKAAWVTVNGYVDAYVPICSYQQHQNGPAYSTVLNCVWPSFWHTDTCGTNWYWFSMSQYLMGSNQHWFTAGTKEYARVFVQRGDGVKQGMYTATGDYYAGPSDSTTCRRAAGQENAAIAPITFYLNGIPDDLQCGSGADSYAGCPFTCNTPGCDINYGDTQVEFYDASYRTNVNGQSTALTRFDKGGYTAAAVQPSGEWAYALESGTCSGGPYYNQPCDSSANCAGYSCYQYNYTMRWNTYGAAESINAKRGERRQNVRVEGWFKTKYRDSYHYEFGLVNRYYDPSRYFVFWINNISGSAMIHGVNNGAWLGVASGSTTTNFLSWQRLGFEIRDRGTVVNGAFQPNGNCWMRGYVNGAAIVANDSYNCSFAPRGSYGPYTYYMADAQFYDLDAFARGPVY